MATIDDMAGTARNLLRDFGQYFEVEQGPVNFLTLRLPHPLVSPISLQVYTAVPVSTGSDTYTSTPLTDWTLDQRNGILKLPATAQGKRVLVAGYHYTWFTDADLGMHVKQMADEHLWNRYGDYDIFGEVEQEVIALGAVVRALNSLALELSLDIDVSTPEGIYIPARQRFTQVLQMMGTWEAKYNEKAMSLNVGLGALEQFDLRRKAYTTGRYVPLYQTREIDDHRWPRRIRPSIPDGTTPITSGHPDVDVIDVTEAMNPGAYDLGWRSIGRSGSSWQPGPDSGSPYPASGPDGDDH